MRYSTDPLLRLTLPSTPYSILHTSEMLPLPVILLQTRGSQIEVFVIVPRVSPLTEYGIRQLDEERVTLYTDMGRLSVRRLYCGSLVDSSAS